MKAFGHRRSVLGQGALGPRRGREIAVSAGQGMAVLPRLDHPFAVAVRPEDRAVGPAVPAMRVHLRAPPPGVAVVDGGSVALEAERRSG